MKEWLYWHFPIITTRWRKNKYVNTIQNFEIERLIKEVQRIERSSVWAAINPVIHSLKELRNNTWDKERVDHAIKWLRDNFEVRDE